MTWIKKKFVLFLSLLLSIQVSLQTLPGNWSIGRGRQLLSLLGQFTAAFIPLRAIHDTSEQAKHQPSGTVGIGCCAASLYLFSSLGNITAAELCPQSSVDLPWLAPEHVSCRRCLLLSFGSGGSAGEVWCREVFWGEHTPERIKLKKKKKTCYYIFLASSCMNWACFYSQEPFLQQAGVPFGKGFLPWNMIAGWKEAGGFWIAFSELERKSKSLHWLFPIEWSEWGQAACEGEAERMLPTGKSLWSENWD